MNRKKKICVILLAALLHCLLPASAMAQRKDTTLTFTREQLSTRTVTGEDGNQYTRLEYQGLTPRREACSPELPYRHITLPIPVNARNVTLQVSTGGASSLKLREKVYPIQWPRITTIPSRPPGFAACSPSVYGSTDGFPVETAYITDVSGSTDTEKRVGIAVCPLKYFPLQDKCDFYGEIQISVSYELAPTRKLSPLAAETCPTELPLYEYCIITSRSLAQSFSRLKGWIRQKGMDAGIVCLEDILSDPAIEGDTVSALYDDAGKIRQYLQYGYKYGGTRYVLFGGNDSIVPVRYGTGEYDWSDYDSYRGELPSDFYFAELNSNWNVDGDTLLGEHFPIVFGECYMDYKAELSVGRILCTTPQEIANYTDKLLLYEINPGRGDRSYLRKAFLSQADGMQELDEAHKVAKDITDIFPDTTIISEFPSYNDDNPTAPTGNGIISEMNHHYGYVSWFSHGFPAYIATMTKGNNASLTTLNAVTSLDNFHYHGIEKDEAGNGLDCLNNKDYPMVAYSIACNIASFDNFKQNRYGNFLTFARSFTTGKDYGGPALIGNTRVGFEEHSYIVQQCFNNYMRSYGIGESLNKAKLYNSDDEGRHHHSLTINVVGCPDLNVWTALPERQDATIAYGQDGVTINPINYSDSTYICLYPLDKNRKAYTLPGNFGNGANTIQGAENCMITLKGRNCLPAFLPLALQNTNVSGDNYIQAADVKVGSDVRNGEQGSVTFEAGSVTEMETTGQVAFTRNVTVQKGAQLIIKQSSIRK